MGARMSEEQLKGYFAFDDRDLLANQSGKLSEKQTSRRKNVDQFADRFVLITFLIFLVIGLLLAYFAVRAVDNDFLWVWTVVLLVIAAWLFRGVIHKVDDSLQKVQGKAEFVRVEKMSGMPTDSMADRRLENFYEMHVGLETFRNVNPALIEYMQGQEFAVYFTKTTKQILSVEEISKGQ
jgi:hypothetical protein